MRFPCRLRGGWREAPGGGSARQRAEKQLFHPHSSPPAETKKRPGCPGRFRFSQYLLKPCLRSDLAGRAVDHLRGLVTARNLDVARLLGLGDLADEVDMEQAVLERGALHLDEIGKLEGALEGPRGN